MSHDFEYFPTPPPFTDCLFRLMAQRGHPIKGHLYEPCVGDGAIIKAAEQWNDHRWQMDWRTNDLDPRWKELWKFGHTQHTALDATAYNTWRALDPAPDFTISNPPFTVAMEIIEHALAHSRAGVAMHVRCSLNEPLKRPGLRQTFLAEHPPSGLIWLPRYPYRRNAKGKRGQDSATCVWMIWLKVKHTPFIAYAPKDIIEASVKYRRAALPLLGIEE